MTSMPVTPCINETLPAEVFGVIFEEHAKLEWRAPVNDGLVCRQWRQTILGSPRAWVHLEIGEKFRSAPSELRQQWLDRSGTAPLHIWASSLWGVEEILDQHYRRIESLTVRHASAHAWLENRSFPILQSLAIIYDYQDGRGKEFRLSACDDIPALRSLRLGCISVEILPSKTFPALRVLALYVVKKCNYIIHNSYHSLTTLMLDSLDVPNTSETLEFPSLSFLSLFGVKNFKHRISVPALTTYHEGYMPEEESFSVPLPLITEYGFFNLLTNQPINVTRLHQCYPNLSRVSVRARVSIVKAFLHSLSGQPTSLLMLRILAVEFTHGKKERSKEDEDSMMNDVSVRNTATSVKMELCFDGKLRVPLYFGAVRVYIKYGRSKLTSILRTQINLIEDLTFVLAFWQGC